MPAQTRNTVLLLLAVVFVVGAVITLIPDSSAAKINDLGYLALCPFSPWSALILLACAGLVWIVRMYLMKPVKRTGNSLKSAPPP